MTTSAAAISDRRARQRRLERLRVALEAGRAAKPACRVAFRPAEWRSTALTDRGAGQQVERDGDRRELALMVDHERRDLLDRR